MIAVTGATGKLGQWVIEDLLKTIPPSDIAVLVRDVSKADGFKKKGIQVRAANYDDAGSWGSALQGVKKLLLISSSEVGKREAQHKTVIRAAKEAKVEHLIYTSILNADTSTLGLATEHVATEKAIKESGIPYTFLRNGWYFENQTENLGGALQGGMIHGAAGEGRFSYASRKDYAEAASRVLRTSGHEYKIYELGGDTAVSLKELAAEVSKQTKKTVGYMNHSFDDYKKALMGFGLPEGFAQLLADSDAKAAKGELETKSKDLSKLIGRPTTTLADAVKKAL